MPNSARRFLEINGVMKSFVEWCEEYKFPYTHLMATARTKGFPLSKVFCDYAERNGMHFDRPKVEDKTKIDYTAYIEELEKAELMRNAARIKDRHAFYDVEYFFPVGASAGRWVVEKNVDYERLNRILDIGRGIKYKEARRVK